VPRLYSVDEMADQAWGHLVAAANDRALPMRLAALATVAPDGRPCARLMVLRGADRATGRLWFHTDQRSPKVADLRTRPWACVVAFDPRDGVQLRLNGTADLHVHDEVADRHWEQATLAIGYLAGTPDEPDLPSPVPDPRLAAAVRHAEEALTRAAREHFAVIEVAVESIDWYQVVEDRARRAVLKPDGWWRATAVPA
jgi:pyridoxamine 5'-phosphate oxidase